MPYTYPPAYFETASAPGNSHDGMKEFVTFLNGTHPTQTNTVPWACIDCYDGATRAQPTSGNLDNLPSGNLWRSDEATPPVNSWAVFQAPSGGDVVNRYQIYVEMSGGSSAFIGIFMLDDWTIGGGTDMNPTIPATALGVPPFAGGMDSTIANHTDYLWKAIVDEGTLILDVFPTVGGQREWFYFGDLVPDNSGALDPRPFIVSRDPFGNDWNQIHLHISVIDDTTVINTFTEVQQAPPFYAIFDQDAFTNQPLCEVSALSNEPGNQYRKGTFRNMAAITRWARTFDNTIRITAGTGPTDYAYEVWGRVDFAPHMVTIYPPGTSLPGGHIEISENSIPTILVPDP